MTGMIVIGVIAILVLAVGLGAILLEVRRAHGLLETKLAELTRAATTTMAETLTEPRPISIGPISVVVEMKKQEKVSGPRRRVIKPPTTPSVEPAGGTNVTS